MLHCHRLRLLVMPDLLYNFLVPHDLVIRNHAGRF